jgi:signal transduction histidine kinase
MRNRSDGFHLRAVSLAVVCETTGTVRAQLIYLTSYEIIFDFVFGFVLATSMVLGTGIYGFDIEERSLSTFLISALDHGWLATFSIVPAPSQEMSVSSRVESEAGNAPLAPLTAAEYAAAIAHEISQPLSALIAQTAAAMNWLSQHPPAIDRAMKSLESAQGCSQRALDIVENLRKLSRESRAVIDAVDLNAAILRSLEFAGAVAIVGQRNVRLELDRTLPTVWGNRLELEIVFLNLVRNAVEAISAVEGPKILKIATFRIDERFVGAIVRDSGLGVPSMELGAIFEPFFSRKTGGLGIGLSLCRRIVAAHSGTLEARNGQRFGVAFEVRLPVGSGHDQCGL